MFNPEFENKNFITNDTSIIDLPVSRILEELRECFDLRDIKNFSDTESFSEFLNQKQQIRVELTEQEIQTLKRLGIRIIREAHYYRAQALRIANCKSEVNHTMKEHSEIAKLFKQYVDEKSSEVLVFRNKKAKDQFLVVDYPSRFTNPNKLYKLYRKAKEILKNAFQKHKDALMLTLTLPRIFPITIEIYHNGSLYGIIPLQDVLITKLKQDFMKRLRKWWKDTKIETFTAYEFYGDYAGHQHVLIFGIPFLIDWSRKFGKGKLDAFSYFSSRYGVPLDDDSPTMSSKRIITLTLNEILERLLETIDKILGTTFYDGYQLYKSLFNLEGPVNEVHRIKDGRWEGERPPDSYNMSPAKYVIKYLLKALNMVKNREEIPPEHQAKVFGYWLLGKRFNSYSPSLAVGIGPPITVETGEEPEWELYGIFDKSRLPDEVYRSLEDGIV
jgi:hypothetical protein